MEAGSDPTFRWLALAIFAAAIAISAERRWRARRATGAIPRRDEPLTLIAGRLLVTLPLFGGVIAYLLNPAWMAWASMTVPVWSRWLGAALGALAVPVVYWILAHLGSNVSETVLTKKAHRLVTTGPYRRVRHPLYATGVLLFLAVGLMAANWFILAWAMMAATLIRGVVVPREEANLERAFGDAYRRYRERTGALIPSWRRTRHGV